MEPAQQGRGLSTSLPSLTLCFQAPRGRMPLLGDPVFSVTLVVQLWWMFNVSVTQIIVHWWVSRTDKPDSCVEPACISLWCVCVSWKALYSSLAAPCFLFCIRNQKQTENYNKVVEIISSILLTISSPQVSSNVVSLRRGVSLKKHVPLYAAFLLRAGSQG